jgi:hypothetical protein
MREMGETVHRISPETALSYQHGAYGACIGHGMGFIYDARIYGKNSVFPSGRRKL